MSTVKKYRFTRDTDNRLALIEVEFAAEFPGFLIHSETGHRIAKQGFYATPQDAITEAIDATEATTAMLRESLRIEIAHLEELRAMERLHTFAEDVQKFAESLTQASPKVADVAPVLRSNFCPHCGYVKPHCGYVKPPADHVCPKASR